MLILSRTLFINHLWFEYSRL